VDLTAETASAAEGPGVEDPERSLRPNSLRFVGTVGNAIGIQAPTAGVAFLPALMAGVVGGAGPLAFLIALVAMGFVAYAFLIFTREMTSAGSIYAFNGRALGSAYGFVSVFLLLAVYLAFAASVFASNANFLERLLPGNGVPWPWLAAAMWIVTVGLTYRRIAVSAAVIVALEALSLCLVAVVAVAVLAHGGAAPGAISAKPFTLGALPIATLGLGVVLAFTGFSGFEVAATFGEETRAPRRIIPTAVVAALLFSGAVYVFMSWIETVGFASPTALAGSSVPLVDIAGHYISSTMGTIIDIAALISGIGAQLACINGANRLLFALGREGFGPAWLARTHPRHRSPVGALVVVALVSLVGSLAMYRASAIDAFFYLSTYGADLILVVYLLTLVGAVAWSLKRGHRNAVRYLMLAAGVVVIGYVIKNTAYPIPEFPFNWCVYGAGITIMLAIAVLALSPRMRARTATSQLFTA
jgi:amino acid transporter